jgi:transposase InsO family protein
VLDHEKALTAVGFLRRAIAHYASYGITVEAVMSDNGGAYISKLHAIACRALKIKHPRTRAYRPQTNGKACVLGSSCRPIGRRGSPHLSV